MNTVTNRSGNRVVFCEGNSGSPDILLWKRVLIQSKHKQANFRVKIEPLGGKQSAKKFARGYTRARMASTVVSDPKKDNWRIIRDRDLDEESPDGEPIIWDKGKTLLTGCTCIESYFLLPDLLQDYIAENPPEYPNHPTDHRASLDAALSELSDYQAVRWALQKLRRQIQAQATESKLFRTAGLFDLPNKLASKDGKFPPSLSLDNCRAEAIRVCEAFRDVFQLVDTNQLDDFIEAYRSRFSKDTFYKSAFRYWFHGKDVLKHWLNPYQIGMNDYSKWASQHLQWTQYPDLIEIQRRCQT